MDGMRDQGSDYLKNCSAEVFCFFVIPEAALRRWNQHFLKSVEESRRPGVFAPLRCVRALRRDRLIRTILDLLFRTFRQSLRRPSLRIKSRLLRCGYPQTI